MKTIIYQIIMTNCLDQPHIIRLPLNKDDLNLLLAIREQAARFLQIWYRAVRTKKQARLYALLVRLEKLRKKAAKVIHKLYKGWVTRKDLLFLKGINQKKLIRWFHEGKSVSIAANFTDPPWKEIIPMRYSKYLKEFISTVIIDRKIPRGTYCIKFLVDGKWMCDGNLAISQDQFGNYNNVISVSDHKQGISRAMSVKSFQTIASELNSSIKSSSAFSPIILVRSISGNLESPRGFGIIEEDILKRPVKLVMAGHMIAKPINRSPPFTEKGSADAWFVDHDRQVFGVADGVSEWSTFGLDPSKFPIELMRHCTNVLNEIDESQQEASDLLEHVVLEASQRIVSYGSSTLLLAVCRSSLLYTYCLGDSSFIVLRKREDSPGISTVYRSVEQQHSFNCPFQLSNLPKPHTYDDLAARGFGSLVSLLKRSSKSMNDSPFDADTEMIPLKIGDIIIAGTDGVFDNLYDQDIIKITEKASEQYRDVFELVRNLAVILVEKAAFRSMDLNYRSPFARNAGKAGKKFMGGKIDDTTVIVAVAT